MLSPEDRTTIQNTARACVGCPTITRMETMLMVCSVDFPRADRREARALALITYSTETLRRLALPESSHHRTAIEAALKGA